MSCTHDLSSWVISIELLERLMRRSSTTLPAFEEAFLLATDDNCIASMSSAAVGIVVKRARSVIHYCRSSACELENDVAFMNCVFLSWAFSRELSLWKCSPIRNHCNDDCEDVLWMFSVRSASYERSIFSLNKQPSLWVSFLLQGSITVAK